MNWEDYEELFRRGQLVPGDLRVCPKLTVAHIYPSQLDKMRVKLATQVFSNGMAGGFQCCQEYGIPELTACDGIINFTIYMTNLLTPSKGASLLRDRNLAAMSLSPSRMRLCGLMTEKQSSSTDSFLGSSSSRATPVRGSESPCIFHLNFANITWRPVDLTTC